MNPVPRQTSDRLALASETMPVSFTEMLGPVTQYVKYRNSAGGHDNSLQSGVTKTPNLEGNTHYSGIFSLDIEDGEGSHAVLDQRYFESADLSEVAAGISSQALNHGSSTSRTGVFPQTLGSYEVHRPAVFETYRLFQANDVDSPGLGYNAAVEDDLFSKLSTPSVHGGNGGNSHSSAATSSMAQLNPALDGWKDLSKANLWNDVHMTQNISQVGNFGENSRFGGGVISPTYHFSGSNTSAQVQEQQISQGWSSQYATKRRRRSGIYAPVHMDGVRGSLKNPGLRMANASKIGRRRESLMGKRKRTDGGPQDVLEGIFIVTRRPNNGQTRSIADLIEWTFEEVNEWFDKRASWEVSHTSSASSQNLGMLSSGATSTVVDILPLDPGDSGFFELPVNLADATIPKKRKKRHCTSGTKIAEASCHEDRKDANTYPCVHENCAYSTHKFGDWKRHMASVHYPGRWACLLKEEDQILPADNTCSSCGIAFESVRNLKQHIHLSRSCLDTSAIVRVFDRKDKLVPHWEKWHKFDTKPRRPGDKDLCERDIRDFDRKCGFCELSFENWDTKIEHVGIHFKDEGRKISTWRYSNSDDGYPTPKKSLNDERALPDDPLYDSGDDSSGSDDSDSDGDGEIDRPIRGRYDRKGDRDRDKGGSSGSGGTSSPPPDGGSSGISDSSLKKSKDNANDGRGHYAPYGRGSVQERATEADDNTSTLANNCWDPEPHNLHPSRGISAHQTIRRLGSGGFGAVDEIRIEGTNQIFARKRIRRFPGRSREIAKELAMIRKLQELNHHHVVQFLGSFVTDSYIDIIMLPVADYDLDQFMLQHQPPVPEAIKTQMVGFCSCLASGLNYIHERAIRHRDIKPKNILVAKGVVLIADFGSATDTNHEAGKEFVGVTPKYTAPEVFKGGRHERAADVWSLGCVMMELMTIIHDKTRIQLDLFRSPNPKLKVAPPFHRTIRAAHEWLNILPKIGTAPSLKWQGNSYLDTIADMIQEDDGERPTAHKLMQSFSPSSCCSTDVEVVKPSPPMNRTGWTELTKIDRISEALSYPGKFYSHNVLLNTRSHGFSWWELVELSPESTIPTANIYKIERPLKKLPCLTRKRVFGTRLYHLKEVEIQVGIPETRDESCGYRNSINELVKAASSAFLWVKLNMQSLRASNKLFYADSGVDMPGPNRNDKGAEDTILGFTVSRINYEEPADTKGRWRCFMEEVYTEIVANRECGSCCDCGVAKVNCRHDPTPAITDQYHMDSHRNQIFALTFIDSCPEADGDVHMQKLYDLKYHFQQDHRCLPIQPPDRRWVWIGDIAIENIFWYLEISDSEIGRSRKLPKKEEPRPCPSFAFMLGDAFINRPCEKGGYSYAEHRNLFIDEDAHEHWHSRKRPGRYGDSALYYKWPFDDTKDDSEPLEYSGIHGMLQEDPGQTRMYSCLKRYWEELAYLECNFWSWRRMSAPMSFITFPYAAINSQDAEHDPFVPSRPSSSSSANRLRGPIVLAPAELWDLNVRQGDFVEVPESISGHCWKRFLMVETGIFHLSNSENILGAMQEELPQAKIEEKVSAHVQEVEMLSALLINSGHQPMKGHGEIEETKIPKLGTRPKLLRPYERYSTQKDNIMSLGNEVFKDQHRYEPLAEYSTLNTQDEALSFFWAIDYIDVEELPGTNKAHGTDPLLLWTFMKSDRNDLNIGDEQRHLIAHWVNGPTEMPVGLCFFPEAGDGRGQGEDFIRSSAGAPERWKDMKGFPTGCNASLVLVNVGACIVRFIE